MDEFSDIEKIQERFDKLVIETKKNLEDGEKVLEKVGLKNEKIKSRLEKSYRKIERCEKDITKFEEEAKAIRAELNITNQDYIPSMFEYKREDLDEEVENIVLKYIEYFKEEKFGINLIFEKSHTWLRIEPSTRTFSDLRKQVSPLFGVEEKHIFFLDGDNGNVFLPEMDIREELLSFRDFKLVDDQYQIHLSLSAGLSLKKILEKKLKGENEDILFEPIPFRELKKKEQIGILDLAIKKKSLRELVKEDHSKLRRMFKFIETMLFLVLIVAWNISWISDRRIKESYAAREGIINFIPSNELLRSSLLNYTVDQTIYKLIYNTLFSEETGSVLPLLSVKGLNAVRLIQNRVKHHDCLLNDETFLKNMKAEGEACKAAFSVDNLNKSTYSDGSAPFVYSEKPNTINIRTRSNLYRSFSGFYVDLPKVKQDYQLTIQTLQTKKWIDEYTSVLMLQWNSFMVEAELLAQMTLILEKENNIEYFIIFDINMLDIQSTSDKLFAVILFYCLVGLSGILLFSNFFHMIYSQKEYEVELKKGRNPSGIKFKSYFFRWPTIFELIAMSTLMCIFALLWVFQDSQRHIDTIDISSKEFIDLSHIVNIENLNTNLNCIIIMNLMICSIQYLSLISKRIKMQYDNMVELLKSTMSLMIVLGWLVIAVGINILVFLGSEYKHFDFIDSATYVAIRLSQKTNIYYNFEADPDTLDERNTILSKTNLRIMSFILTVALQTVVNYIIFPFIVMSLIHYYANSRIKLQLTIENLYQNEIMKSKTGGKTFVKKKIT